MSGRPGIGTRLLRLVVPKRYRPRVWSFYAQTVYPLTRRPSALAHGVHDLPRRVRLVNRYEGFRHRPLAATDYVLRGRELANFTYDIANRSELAGVIAATVGATAGEAAHYIDELDRDDEFRRRLRACARRAAVGRPGTHYGRRLGWYALVRLTAPALVVETGVDAGLGSAVLLRALQRNTAEGRGGRLISVDLRPEVGVLVDRDLRELWTLRVGDGLETLASLSDHRVDMFIHDSLHTYDHETAELETVLPLATATAVLVSDNAHGVPAFRDFCERHALPFHLFMERPVRHFYPGAGLGATRLGTPGGSEVTDAPAQ